MQKDNFVKSSSSVVAEPVKAKNFLYHSEEGKWVEKDKLTPRKINILIDNTPVNGIVNG